MRQEGREVYIPARAAAKKKRAKRARGTRARHSHQQRAGEQRCDQTVPQKLVQCAFRGHLTLLPESFEQIDVIAQ